MSSTDHEITSYTVFKSALKKWIKTMHDNILSGNFSLGYDIAAIGLLFLSGHFSP